MNALTGKDAFVSDQPSAGPSEIESGSQEKKSKRRWWLIPIVLAAIGAGYVWWNSPGDTAPSPVGAGSTATSSPVAIRLNPSELVVVERGEQAETVKFTGTLVPARQASVSSRTAGEVLAINVRAGDRVEEGDIIARLDTQELLLQGRQQEASIEATRAQLSLAESQLETTRTLVSRGSSPQSALRSLQASVDELNANLKAQQAQLETLELNIANATIRAPFTGIIAERSIDPGQSVNPGLEIVKLVDISAMEVAANASLADGLLIDTDQFASITVESLNDAAFDGRVIRVSPIAAEGTRQLPISLSIDNSSGILRGGMFVTGDIIVSQSVDVLSVPTSAILEDFQGAYVLVVEDERVVRRAVETGNAWRNARMIEVSDGLETGETIVAQELSGLTAGATIVVEGR